ncbi:MAG: hypothetical protein IPI97_09885 [Nitrosomonas sp.]|nr:hypothetical protein [Nitrosomonas sp.]
MQMNKDRKITFFCSLRFIVNKLEEVESFKNQFKQYDIKTRPYFEDKTKYVISIRLVENTDYQSLVNYVQGFNGKLNHDFFISVSSEKDSEIVEVPNNVVEFIRSVGGKLHFSYTCIS